MSVADYTQRAEDHQCLLVLVQQVGSQLRSKTFTRLYERVARLTNISIPGQQRNIWLRYKKSYSVDNNEWGDFQAHRKVLGVICVGRCSSEQELTEVYKQYDRVRQDYAATLYDCRLVVFGLSKDGSHFSQILRQDSEGGDIIDQQGDNNGNRVVNGKTEDKENHNADLDNSINNQKLGKQIRENERTPASTESNGSSVPGTKPHVIFYPNSEDCPTLEDQVREFAASLFWVLESKRLDRSQERMDRLPLLVTPFEKKDIVGIDTDTRTYKRRCQGRLRKHLGDLSLLAGLPAEALLHYQTALDILRSANDWLWLGAAQEGVCSASVIINYPQSDPSPLRRNLSFHVKHGSPSLPEAKLRSGYSSRTIPNGLDLFDVNTRSALSPDDIFDKYREAIMQYSKYKNAGIVELEASIKACKVLIMQQKCMEAAEFLKNVVYINLQLTDDEKIQRYSILAVLYSQIGFHRKSAFFRRIAAMQCVAPSVEQAAWSQCYGLLHQTLQGYKLPLDPRDRQPGVVFGWPVVQVRVLHEMIYSSRKMGNPPIAIRHLTYLLHTLFDHLTTSERGEVAGVLESYTSKCEGSAQPLALDTGVILPPVPFTRFPTIKSFKLQPLPTHLRPSLITAEQEVKPAPVFIYSPIQNSDADDINSNLSKMNFKWVEGDVCEVVMQAFNPMPFELRITNMSLLTEGTEFESYPATLSLPADSGPFPIKILGTPHSVGKLTISGYVTHVLGVRSHCRLRDMPAVSESHYSVEVVPAMPQMTVTTSLPSMDTFLSSADDIISTATTNMYTGQSKEWVLTFTNTSRLPVQFLEVSLDSSSQDTSLVEEMFIWNNENLQSQLPVPPGGQVSLTVYIKGLSQFFTGLNDYATTTGKSTESLDIQSQVVDAVLMFRYSGGTGFSDGYCRQLRVNINVHLSQALVVTKCDVQPAESMHQCHLVLDIRSMLDEEVELQYAATQILMLPPLTTKRVAVLVPRFAVDKTLWQDVKLCEADDSKHKLNMKPQPHLFTGKRKPVNRDGSVKSEEEESTPLEQLHSELLKHLASHVDIRWKISEEIVGNLNCDSVIWTRAQLDRLCLPPLLWEIELNGVSHEPGQIIQCMVGDCVEVHAKCINQSGVSIENAVLTIDCNRDNKQNCQSEAEQVVVIGNSSQTCFQLLPEGTITHSCKFQVLCSGDFNISVHCSGAVGHLPNMTSSESQLGRSQQVKISQIIPKKKKVPTATLR